MAETDITPLTLDDYRDPKDDPSVILDAVPDSTHTVRIVGSPGSGKTSMITGLGDKLKGIVDHLTDDLGYGLSKLYVTSFSKAQTQDLVSVLPELDEKGNISTLHSLFYSEISPDKMILGKRYGDYNKIENFRAEFLPNRQGKELSYPNDPHSESLGSTICGDIHRIHSFIRSSNKEINTKNVIKAGVDISKYTLSIDEFQNLLSCYDVWLRNNGYETFASMSYKAANKNKNSLVRSEIDCMIVDEAQDLSDVQVDYIQSIEDSLDILVTIRDNDQSIYSYRSENVGSHIIQNPDDVIRQDETHRCSQKVAEYAASLGNFDLQSARPSIGSVELDERALGNIVRDLSGNLMKNNKTDIFVLTRTRRQKKKVERLLLKSNIHYSGISDIIYSSKNTPAVVETLQSFARGDYPSEITDFADSSDPLTSDLIETYCENKRLSDREIEMVKRVLDEEEYLDDVDIKIGTYHSSKGLEANSAILCSDWISKRNPEHPEERRVAYVGATRAREDLRVTSIGQGQQNQILRNAAAEFGWNN